MSLESIKAMIDKIIKEAAVCTDQDECRKIMLKVGLADFPSRMADGAGMVCGYAEVSGWPSMVVGIKHMGKSVFAIVSIPAKFEKYADPFFSMMSESMASILVPGARPVVRSARDEAINN